MGTFTFGSSGQQYHSVIVIVHSNKNEQN